jgi:GDPmannose 4,6-dehydratase
MKAVIFGVTGQDGSHLADLLLEKKYEVIGVARRSSTDSNCRIKHILNNKNFTLYSADITDAYSVMNLLKEHANVDEVYNLAAQSHVAVSFKQPALTWDVTGKGCLNILQALVDLNLLGVRFYQASSSEMYGKNYDELSPGNKFQNEETKFMPQSPYAIAKCAAHYMTALFRDGYNIHASAGILFNHEGPRRGENFVTRKITKWIGEFVKSGRDPEFSKLRLGNLEAFRDWGYAGDYVEAMWMMLQQDSPQDFVICTGETHTIREFLDVAFSSIDIEDWSDLVVQDPEFYRPAEVDYLKGDCSKANEILGWSPKYSFEDLVKLMVDHDTK